MELLSFLSTISCIILASLEASMALDSIIQSQSISLSQTLISKSERFELGFFNPGNSEQTFLGIWYHKIPVKTVVWVANRLKPINGSSGSAILTLNSSGNLVLSLNGTVLWHTSSANQAKNPVAELLDSGNLVVRDEKEANPEAYLWQSFDYPTDTLLPEMKFGWDLRKGLSRHLIAWKSPDDPSPGDFSWSIELYNYPDSVMWKGKRKYYRMGAWNGMYPSGVPAIRSNSVFDDKYVSNKNEIYYMYSLKNNSLIIRFVMNQTDYTFYCNIWIEAEQNWSVCGSSPKDICDHFGHCGVYAICSTGETPSCQCLSRFRPKSPQIWNSMDWTQGCVRNTPLSCEDKHKDGFFQMFGLKLPDTEHSWLDETISIEECKERCLNNCSCMAYTSSNVSDGSGCAMWFDDLIDITLLTDSGQYLYIRMPASELEEVEHGHRKKLALTIATTTIVAISGMLLVMCCYIHNVRRKMTEKLQNFKEFEDELDEDLPFHDLPTISAATNNFSPLNKIGEGGFGPVYKARLNGQEIAVKRLSRSSRQGMTEFKNEVKLIAKLQHRNLVKLVGCCIQGEEKILLYEFMPNSSLDSFIFDHTKGKLLDWATRYHIICGIARGLLYLHQDSILKIIHRDLKASNVLLDDKLNPKISDFGLARIFGGDQTDANTSRIVGTYGYMAPEYAADGLFSMKSDVFSFGILLLEIICGMRNRGFYHQDGSLNLIGRAWMLWKEGTAMELIDPNIKDSCIVSEVMRCMHVSLLCVQHYPENRPIMPSVVLMLESEIELTEPREPGFFPRKVSDESQTSPIEKKLTSTNELSITQLDAR